MALVLADRVKETAAAPGTGTVTLLGAATGFQSFSTIGNANTTYYTIADQSGGNWEVGIGTYTASGSTLTRDTVLSSSNAGALVNFSSGVQDVFVTYPAEVATVLLPVNYSYTGTMFVPPIIAVGYPAPVQALTSGGALGAYRGKWASALTIPTANAGLTSLTFDDLQGVTGSIFPNFSGIPSVLTTLSFPALTTVGGFFQPISISSLTTLSLPALTTVVGGFRPTGLSALTTLSAPALTTVGGVFDPSNMSATLTTLSVPALTTVGGNFNPSVLPGLTTLNILALTTVGGTFNVNNTGTLTTISAPALTTIGSGFTIAAMTALTTISIPAIVQIGIAQTSGNVISIISGTAALTTFQLPSTLKQVGLSGGNVVITSAALNQTSVDSILVALAALDGTNGTTTFNNRTVTITGTSATPSATGLAAKATLVARGCTVTTN